MHFTRFLQTRSFFAFVLIVAFLFEALLISYRNEETILQAASSDEALFLYDALRGYSKFIDTLDPNVFPNGFPGPYGHPFWLFLGVLNKIAQIGAFEVALPTALIFLALKYVAAMFWRETLALRLDGGSANALALALLVSPGLFFYGKIISPEFQMLALISAGIYFVTRAFIQGRLISWFGLTLLFLAVYTKISNLPFFAAAWLATGVITYRNCGTRHTLRILSVSALIFTAAALLACTAAGGLIVTAKSILMLPTPPAIFQIDHLWNNLTNSPSYTWDQVKLIPLTSAFPILFIAMAAGLLGVISQRRCSVSVRESPFLWILLTSALAMLMLLLAKSLNYSWYLFVPAIVASLTLFMLSGSSFGWRGILMIAALAVIVGIPASIHNVAAEMRKRSLVLDGKARSNALIATAHALCPEDDARIILDVLIPDSNQSDQRVLVLRYAVMMPDVQEDIARKRPVIIISHEKMFTESSAAKIRLIQPANAHFEIIRHPAHTGYVFRLGEGCRQYNRDHLSGKPL